MESFADDSVNLETLMVNYVLFFGGMVLLCFIMLKLGHYYWSYRLNQWSADQGLKLVDFRGAKFYEGPSAWVRSDTQHVFRVQVEDKQEIGRAHV